MGEVIEVNFKTGKRIQKYVCRKWSCVTCSAVYTYDSRKESNKKYIKFTSGALLCEDCAMDIYNTIYRMSK